VYPASFQYSRATSFPDAVSQLSSAGTDAKLLAGGQTLLPLLKLRIISPSLLIDLGGIRDADQISIGERGIRFGALARHADVAESEAAAIWPVLRDCALGIADPQVRNMGTVGGSLAEADPCSDWPLLFWTLDATVECLGPDGPRRSRVRDFLREPYAPALRPGELITGVEIPRPVKPSFMAYGGFKRCAQSYPTASCAVMLELDGERCRRAAIGLGCLALTPVLAEAAASQLTGRQLDASIIRSAASAAAASTDPVADVKGTIEYKRALAAGLVERTVHAAWARARGLSTEPSHVYYGR
jgi:carbon-monoxide dehydrogenase medium subunit